MERKLNDFKNNLINHWRCKLTLLPRLLLYYQVKPNANRNFLNTTKFNRINSNIEVNLTKGKILISNFSRKGKAYLLEMKMNLIVINHSNMTISLCAKQVLPKIPVMDLKLRSSMMPFTWWTLLTTMIASGLPNSDSGIVAS